MTAAQLATALDAKKLATATARAALAGITLQVIEGDDGRPEMVASRWALSKRFNDLADVERWLDQVTGAKG